MGIDVLGRIKQAAGTVLFIAAGWLQIMPAAAAVGVIPGQFAVSETGAATYTIPLAVPPGTAGMEPKLALAYNSQGGNGLLGVGWSLSGLSAITRCPRTIVQDGANGGVEYSTNDKYCLDGQRLVAVTGNYGANATEYRTELESFTKVISYGTAGNGPAWFKVWTKSGQIIEYGNTADSRIEAQGKTTAAVWAVNRISDTKGNYLTVAYTEDNANGQYYPTRIDYTGNANTGLATYNSVQFVYETRPDTSPQYVGGSLINLTQRLTKVHVYAGSTLNRDYRLAFDQSMSTQRSRLIQIEACTGDGSCLPMSAFGWQEQPKVGFYRVLSDNSDAGRWPTDRGNRDFLVDVNGDGKIDHVWIGAAGTYVELGRGDGSFYRVLSDNSDAGRWPTDRGNRDFLVDVNGDGKIDHVWIGAAGTYVELGRGDGSFYRVLSDNSDAGRWPTDRGNQDFLVDVNGDGKIDHVWIGAAGTYVELGRGDGSFYRVLSDNSDAGRWPTDRGNQDFLVDVNGDGKIDHVWIGAAGTYVELGRGDGSFYRVLSDNSDAGRWPTDRGNRDFLLDVNGDGKIDHAWIGAAGTYVELGRGDGSFYRVLSDNSDAGRWPTDRGNRDFLLDVNGDGKIDHAWIGAAGTYVELGRGDGSFYRVLSDNSDAGRWPTDRGNQDFLVDTNGDGVVDHVWIGAAGTYVEFGLGPISNLLTTITNGLGAVTSITYKPLTDGAIYTKDSDAGYPMVDLQVPLYVVASVTTDNGLGGQSVVTHHYTGAKTHLTGRGFLGFRAVESTNQQTNLVSRTEYRQDHPYTGMPSLSEKSHNGVVLNRSTPTYGLKTFGSGSSLRNFPYAQQSVEESYELSGSLVTQTTTSQTYDDWGNPTQIVVTSNDGHGKTTVNTYDNDTTNWILGRLRRATVTSTAP